MDEYKLLKRDIRKYIYEAGWRDLRPIQRATLKLSHLSKDNLILVAPTASGKTEAAFLPAINLVEDWEDSVKILYISPLKALINDQFKRILKLCEQMGVRVTSWHGEASQRSKEKLVENPSGILLITPESIEAMLVHRPDDLKKLFENLQWIILDEIHSFLENPRGLQLRSLLNRLKKYSKVTTRYMGMSASVNKEDFIYLKGFFPSQVETKVLLDKGRNQLKKTLSFYPSAEGDKIIQAVKEIFAYSQKESMLVFPNSRSQVESLTNSLNELSKTYGSKARYFAHHSSISKSARKEIEEFVKEASEGEVFSIIATSTLELGIDLGSVDSVVQYNPPASATSLAQRLGRSGRQSGVSVLHFIGTDPWYLVQGLAAIRLYEDGNLERINLEKKVYQVLGQQVLSTLIENNGLTYEEIKELFYNQGPFSDIDEKEFQALINHMIRENYIESLERKLIIGSKSEDFLKMGDFYSQFQSEDLYNLYFDGRKIGSLPLGPDLREGFSVILAGQLWEIKSIDKARKRIEALRAEEGEIPSFSGKSLEVKKELRSEMKNILFNKTYKEMDDNIVRALDNLTDDHYAEDNFIWTNEGLGPGLRTFQSTKVNRTLTLVLNLRNSFVNYKFYDRETLISGKGLKRSLKDLQENFPTKEEVRTYLLRNDDLIPSFVRDIKFMDLVPRQLQAEYIIENLLDLNQTYLYLNPGKNEETQ